MRELHPAKLFVPTLLGAAALFLASSSGCSKPGSAPPPAATGSAAAGARATARPFTGTSVTVAVPSDSPLAGHVKTSAAAWKEATGGEARVVETSAEEMKRKVSAGRGEFDVIVYPVTWAGDFMSEHHLRPFGTAEKTALDWDDVMPLCRDLLASWRGEAFAVPIDGEAVIVYYRLDLLRDKDNQALFKEKTGERLTAPRTWDDYRRIAEFFNGRDFTGDGQPDFGTVEPGTGEGSRGMAFLARAASYDKRGDGPALFFDSETMEARIAEPAFVKALEDVIEIQKAGPPGMASFSQREVRSEFLSGRAAMALDGCDLATLTVDPERSKVKNQVGFALLPGSNRVFESETSTWSESKAVHFAPYLAGGGWLVSVTAKSAKPSAAADFVACVASKNATMAAVAALGSPMTPFRAWHTSRVSDWTKLGFTGDSARDYLTVVQASQRHPNGVSDLRIPGWERYARVLETAFARALSNEAPAAEALETAAAEWNAITAEIGKDRQRSAYRDSLGNLPD